jgi:putative hydrolase of the HAD superfamily
MIAKITHPARWRTGETGPALTRSGRWLPWPTIGDMPEMRAVITDWGGVLTQPIGDTVRDWIAADQIDWDTYVAVVGPWLSDAYDGEREHEGAGNPFQLVGALTTAVNPVHALERGECTVADFERLLAARLVTTTGGKVMADGLLTRMLSASRPDPLMYQVIRDLRGRGVRTALLSNSWGSGSYPRQDFPGLFDAVVISSEVGMRKPEARIFLHAAGLLDVAPAECVFIDDMDSNVRAAVGCGMTGMHHTDPADTIVRLTELFAAR